MPPLRIMPNQGGSNAMAEMTGGCLCGKVRYTTTGDPAFSGICHCRNCQRYTGSAFEPVIAFPSASVSVQGELKTYDDTGDSGKSFTGASVRTAAPGWSPTSDIMPGVTLVLAGTLDDTAAFKPAMEIYCSSAQPWTQTSDERKRFPQRCRTDRIGRRDHDPSPTARHRRLLKRNINPARQAHSLPSWPGFNPAIHARTIGTRSHVCPILCGKMAGSSRP